MTHLKIRSISAVASFLVLGVAGYGCSESRSKDEGSQSTEDAPKKGKKHKQKQQEQQQAQAVTAPPDADDTGCDATLWKHVYNPSRLQVLDQCKVVTGLVEEPAPDDDGDLHALLKLDPGQENLVNKKNQKKKNGGLVIEIVCAAPVTLPAAIESCKGYHTSIALPKAGQHVKVSGSYVIDTHNGWAELHPVSSIQVTR